MTQILSRTPARRHVRAPERPPRPTPLLREVYGRLIRRLRGRQGRTLTDVATRAGVSVAYLSEMERGLKEPSSEMLEAVCTALGSSIADLLGAAHRELVGDDTFVAATNTLRLGTVSALDGDAGVGVLDLTERHPGRSVRLETSGVTSPSVSRAVTLVAA